MVKTFSKKMYHFGQQNTVYIILKDFLRDKILKQMRKTV